MSSANKPRLIRPAAANQLTHAPMQRVVHVLEAEDSRSSYRVILGICFCGERRRLFPGGGGAGAELVIPKSKENLFRPDFLAALLSRNDEVWAEPQKPAKLCNIEAIWVIQENMAIQGSKRHFFACTSIFDKTIETPRSDWQAKQSEKIAK